MASNQNPSEWSSTADSLIKGPASDSARTDTLSDAALAACRADCDATWKTNWYQQQVTLLINSWRACETEAEAYRKNLEKQCDSYGDLMLRGICYRETYYLTDRLLTSCVNNNSIKPNEGLKSPVNYTTWGPGGREPLSFYDGQNGCASRISQNADAKSTTCKNKNCR